jgi:hypothetical protein
MEYCTGLSSLGRRMAEIANSARPAATTATAAMKRFQYLLLTSAAKLARGGSEGSTLGRSAAATSSTVPPSVITARKVSARTGVVSPDLF